MQTKSRTTRIVQYSGLAVLVSAMLFLSGFPGSRHWFTKDARHTGEKASTPDGNAGRQAFAAHSNSPLRFEENEGQTAQEVRFVSHGSGYELFLTPQEAVLALHPTRRLDLSPKHRVAYFRARRNAAQTEKTSVVRMRLANANPEPHLAGIDRLPGRVDYFTGSDPKNWRTNVPSYRRVRYSEVYPGVDLVYYGSQLQLEYDFVVAPGADPNAIELNVEGARKLRMNSRGDLMLTVSGGEVELHKPLVYQESEGKRREISGNYSIYKDRRVKFTVAKYDHSQPLVIDPILIYSTYLGGELDDSAQGIALDTLGDVAVVGTTVSLQFPTTTGAFTQAPLASNPNGVVFVTLLDPTGTKLLYSTYVGGTGGDSGFGVAFDLAGNIYATGETTSIDFPTTANALKSGLNAGNVNGTSFVLKINPSTAGTGSLAYSSYLGGTQGSAAEFGNGITTDSNGNVYVVGLTQSSPGTALANFPVTASTAFQPTPNAANTTGTAFLTKINPALFGSASLIYSTYLGGNGIDATANAASPGFGDAAFGVAEDSLGISYIAGTTASTNFPTTNTAFQTAAPAAVTGGTAFVARIDTTKAGAASLLYSTYLGGDASDFNSFLALGPSNVAYITGSTSSLLFPTTAGAFQTTGNTAGIAFVSLLDTSLSGATSLKYSTFLGGLQPSIGFGIATDVSGNAYVGGGTQGSDFPVTKGALQMTLASGAPGEGFVTKLNPGGKGAADLIYSTYFGGSGSGGTFDEVNGIVIDPASSNAYFTGNTSSSAASFPVAPGAFQSTLNGPSDAFITQLAFINTVVVSPASLTFGPQLVGTPTAAKTVSLTNNANAAIAFTSVAISGGAPAAANTDFTSPANTCGTSVAAGASCTVSVVYTPSGTAVETANLVITDADATSPQTATLSGTGTTTAPSFTVSAAPASLTVAQGASGTFTVTVTPAGGFNQAVALACTGTPTMSTCSVAPTSVTPTDGTTPVTATVTVATTSPSVAPPSSTPNPPISLWRFLSLALALLLLFLLTRSQKLAARLSMGAAMVAFLALAGCGGGKPTHVPTGGTPKGTSTLTVTGASGTLTGSAAVSLTVD